MGDDLVVDDELIEEMLNQLAAHLGVAREDLTTQMYTTALADAIGRPEGVPVPIEGFRMRVQDREPAREQWERSFDMTEDNRGEVVAVRNRWYCRQRNADVILYERRGRVRLHLDFRYQHVARLDYWMSTLGASHAWSVSAELEAQQKLKSLIKPHLFDMYQLTGTFIETSPRSQLIYLLRRGRPTVVLTPLRRWIEDSPLKVLSVLCLHPIAYYERSWAGAMVPTDDVIAHLLYIRGDEAGFWRRANQHDPESPEAGL